MSKSWLRLCVVCSVCGVFLLTVHAADPKKSPAKEPEPTPIEQPDGPQAPAGQPEVQPQADLQLIPPAEQPEDKGPWEVTHQVELVFKEALSIKAKQVVSGKVLLKNKSEEDIAGKIVLVIDGSSIPNIELQDPQGQFTESTPYLQMVPAKRSLEVGKETPAKTLILKSKDPIENQDHSEIQLHWRAFTLTKPASLDLDPPADDVKVPGKGYAWGDLRKTMSVQERVGNQYIGKFDAGVVGMGTSEDENGNLILRVFASRGGLSRKLPGSIEGIPVEVTVTGQFKAGPSHSSVTYVDGQAETNEQNRKQRLTPESSTERTGQPKTSTLAVQQAGPPTRRFNRPVPIGVSILNQNDQCAAGTLGCRCKAKDGRLFILSNNHVVSQQNAGLKNIDPICQPGPLDLPQPINCNIIPTDVIGTMTDFQIVGLYTPAAAFQTAPVNVMDAGVAVTPVGQVDVCTPIGGYGTPSRFPQENLYPGMPVMKYGRTTSFTRGKIVTLNSEVILAYSVAFARFRGCINIQTSTRTPAFGGPGDSGSLVVTQSDRRPIGILFAGGGFDTLLNPISPVLHRFRVGVDDGTGAAPVFGSGRMGSAVGPVKQHQNVTPL